MINHARTLLLNVASTGGFDVGVLGEEYIHPDFRPVASSEALRFVRRVLFGSAPDRLMLNYRARQLFSLLHTSPYIDHVLALDSRVTYWPGRDTSLFVDNFGNIVTQTNGADSTLTVVGESSSNSASGQLRNAWLVTVIDASNVRVARDTGVSTVTRTYTVSGGLSSPIPLHGSGLFVRFREDAVGSTWHVDSRARPSTSLPQIVAALRQSLPPAYARALFYSNEEPYKTFRNLWYDHDMLTFQLCGFLLAAIYAADREWRA